MKKFKIAMMVMLGIAWSGLAHADLYGIRHGQPAPFEAQNMRASSVYSSAMSDDILSNLSAIIGALGVRDGMYYDFKAKESVNFAAATIVTFDPAPVSIDLGLIGLDGVGVGVGWNIGESLPVENVPLIKMFKYVYLEYVAGLRHHDEDGWVFSHGPVVSAKFTY